MRRGALVHLFFYAVGLLISVTPLSAESSVLPGGFDSSHAVYGLVLTHFVKEGLVDYAGLKARSADLTRYLTAVSKVSSNDFARWSQSDQLSLLLNLYNAQTLALIVEHYPLKSIREIGWTHGAAWKMKIVNFRGATFSLEHLENEIIRKEYRDTRTHFAMVCASKSCPPLRREPYVGAELNAQLEDQGRLFLRDPFKNRWDPQAKTLWLSSIFDWYADDFKKAGQPVLSAASRYLPETTAAAITNNISGAIQVRFLNYDWSLNTQSR